MIGYVYIYIYIYIYLRAIVGRSGDPVLGFRVQGLGFRI